MPEIAGDIEFTPEGPSLGTVSVSADFSFTITAETTGDTCGEDVVEKLDELFPYAVKKTYEPYLSPSMATELGLSFLNYAKADTDEGRIRHLTNSYKLSLPINFIKLFSK